MTTTTKQRSLTSDLPNWHSLVGNLISQEGAGGELITDGDYYRQYNDLHQLIKVRKKTATGKIIEEYFYGPDGERIMTVNSITNTTIYTPFREWMQIVNSTGSYNYTYVYDGNTLVARHNPDGSKWFYHNDHLGSTTLITDEDGNIVEETFYTPFGQTTSGGEQESYYLYTNQFKDAIGCYDYGARVYCPEWYHFTSADPVIASVYDPQGLNHYSYVKNNPYKYVDPSGKRIKKGGARGSYAPAGHWSSKYGGSGGKGGGGSFYVSYWIEGRDEETKVKGITEDEFEDYQEKAKQYADTSVYGAFTSNVEQEYLVYLLEAHEGKEYEYRSATQQAIENKWIQIGAGAVVGAGVGTAATVNPIGTVLGGIIGGVATGGTFALADLSEKEAIKGQTNLRNINMAYVDTLVSGFGGLVGKAGLGVKTGDDVVIDIATDVAVGSGYEATKPYIFEGGENYG